MVNFARRCLDVNKERRLGRGLEALLSRTALGPANPEATGVSNSSAPGFTTTIGQTHPTGFVCEGQSAFSPPPRINVHDIDRNPYQPRTEFDVAEIASLAESLRVHGLLQPIVVRPHEGRYQLISGERRLRAAMLAGWHDVPVHVVHVEERETAELALVENLQRKDLNALEKAASFEAYLRKYACTQEQLAQRLQLDRSTIANLIRLLDLPELIQEQIRQGKISPGHGRALLGLPDARRQLAASEQIMAEGLSVRATEQLVQSLLCDPSPTEMSSLNTVKRPEAGRKRNSHLAALEEQFKRALGAKVEIRQARRGGKIVIHFKDDEEFERLSDLLCEPNEAPRRLAG